VEAVEVTDCPQVIAGDNSYPEPRAGTARLRLSRRGRERPRRAIPVFEYGGARIATQAGAANCPNVVGGGRGDSVERGARDLPRLTGGGDDAPGGSVPVFRQRRPARAGIAPVADGPDVIGRGGGHPEELAVVVAGGRVRRGHDAPSTSVPILGQRLAASSADRPHVVGGHNRHRVEGAVVRVRVRAAHNFPCRCGRGMGVGRGRHRGS
jgi:hypothetical protein